MIEWIRVRLRERALRERARDALCEHDGSEPMCNDCAFAFNPPA